MLRRFGLLCLVLLSACSTNQQSSSATDDPTRLRVVTSMSILADIVRNVGGERIQVTSIIPIGAGPEEYQATPGDSQRIAAARIVFYNGHGLEDWIKPLFENAAPDQPQIELSANLPTLADGNPHFWLDPTYVMTYTTIIQNQLTAIDPAGADIYRANAAVYLEQLQQLDAELAAQAQTLPAERRKLVTNHDAFPYFAHHYGFEIIGVLLRNPEAELSAGELSRLIVVVKQSNIHAIFAESQFSQRTARLLADEAGITTIAVLYTDTLGNDTASSYIAMMRYNMRTVVDALSQ